MQISNDFPTVSYVNYIHQPNKVQETSTENIEKSSSYDMEIDDKAMISDESKQLLENEKKAANKNNNGKSTDEHKVNSSTSEEENLSEEEKKELEKIKERDKEVRRHEEDHKAAAGSLAPASAQYEYTQGPDGKMYVKDGEVDLKVKEEDDPEKAKKNAEQLKRAALAPEEPSAQDMKVAQEADRMIQEANQKLNQPEGTSEATNINTQAQNNGGALAGITQNVNPFAQQQPQNKGSLVDVVA